MQNNNENLPPEYMAMLEKEFKEQQKAQKVAERMAMIASLNLSKNEQQALIDENVNTAVEQARIEFQNTFQSQVPQSLNAQDQAQLLNFILQEDRDFRRASKANLNEGLYSHSKNILLSEPAAIRQMMLKVFALDDVVTEERIKLAHAKTDEERRAIATKIAKAQELKRALESARHRSTRKNVKKLSNEQLAQYEEFVRNVNFNAIPYSLYPRLVQNNAEKTAATKIQSKFRGYTTRKQYMRNLNSMRAARNAEKARKEKEAANLAEKARKAAEEAERLAAAKPVTAENRRKLMAEAAARRFAKKSNEGNKSTQGGRRTHKKAKRSRKN
jgi:hypothetical protein